MVLSVDGEVGGVELPEDGVDEDLEGLDTDHVLVEKMDVDLPSN